MEKDKHIEKLSKLVKVLESSFQEGGRFWWVYGLYQSVRGNALRLGLVSENEIRKYDEEIELCTRDRLYTHDFIILK